MATTEVNKDQESQWQGQIRSQWCLKSLQQLVQNCSEFLLAQIQNHSHIIYCINWGALWGGRLSVDHSCTCHFLCRFYIINVSVYIGLYKENLKLNQVKHRSATLTIRSSRTKLISWLNQGLAQQLMVVHSCGGFFLQFLVHKFL